MVKILLILAHAAVVLPWLRDGDHHGQGQLHAAHHHKFQRIVQHGRIGAGGVDGRKDLVQLSFQIFGGHGLFPCTHLVRISQDGVDLPVVHHEPVGMGPLPAGIGVGAEPGMHHGDGGFVVLILQVLEEEPQLSHQEHALVDNGPAGKGDHIGIVAALLKDPACHIQPTVKGQALLCLAGTLDKSLHDTGHALHRFFPEHLRMDGDLAPAQEPQALFCHDDFEDLFRLVPFQFVLGKEEHPHSVIPFSG